MTSIDQAFAHCEALTRNHYENFPVGSFLIPKSHRPYVWSVYAFARTADDFADEDYPSSKDFKNPQTWREAIGQQEPYRLQKLEAWGEELRQCSKKKSIHPIFMALGKTLRDLDLPLTLFQDLLTAFKMDVTKRRYQNWEEVLHYCRHSANPVGRLVLKIFGYNEEKLFEMSDAICTGLQLANFWQDIAVDLQKDRIYIPQDLLARHKLSDEDLWNPSASATVDLQRLLEDLGKFTLAFFEKGHPLPSKVKGRLAWELRCTWLGGRKILQRSCWNPHRKNFSRPHLHLKDKFSLLWKSAFSYNSCL